jgi:GT2 family glycosyltransferase
MTAIVPATDRPPTLDRCVEAIRRADAPPEEVIVVSEPAGAGPAEARNLGAVRATGDVLVFVDADVVVHADASSRLRARLHDGGLDGVFGSYDDAPEAAGLVSRFRNLLHHHTHQEAAGPVGSFWAGLGALRREAFDAVGGFDDARFPAPAIEDIDLGWRLAAAGRRVELDPEVRGTHLKAWSLAGMIRTDLLARGAPWVELALTRRALPTELNLGWRHRASAALSLAAAAAVVTRRPVGALTALAALGLLNRRFYRLLARRLGAPRAAAGVGLHALHHLTGAAAVALGAWRYAVTRRRARPD